MAAFDFDLLVIGAGSAGVRCARIASQLGAKVAVVENRYLGGTCVNVGCVPKKLFVYASAFAKNFEAAKGYGWDVQQNGIDWPLMRDKKTEEIQRLNRVYESILANSNVEIIEGSAKITGPNTVRILDKEVSSERIVIATGGWPRQPTYPGAEFALTSNEIFSLERLPKRVLVEGGGYIAVEFAGIFNGLGCETDLLYRGPLFLRGFDQDIREFLANEMKEQEINLRFESSITSVEKREDGSLRVNLSDGGSIQTDLLFSAIGRRPMTDDLGLENTQVKMDSKGFVQVNDIFQTDEPSIFALGDVVGRMALTPVALNEGMALAKYLFNNEDIKFSYDNIATAVFSQPEIATVGLSEEQAKEKYGEIEVYKSQFKPLMHTISGLAERTLMKLIVDKSSQKVIGCHMVGEHAGEIMQGVAIAMKMGATKQDFDNTVGIHPTAAEEFVTMR